MSYDQLQEPEDKFWTPALKSLVVVNIVFILLILVGLVVVMAALSPALHDYILDIFDWL